MIATEKDQERFLPEYSPEFQETSPASKSVPVRVVVAGSHIGHVS